MDLVCTGTPAVLIPTPGQTEQEYLAVHLEQEGYFPYIKQDEFTLEAAIEKAGTFTFRSSIPDFNTHVRVLDELIPSILDPKKS
jgi:hypothetical protein